MVLAGPLNPPTNWSERQRMASPDLFRNLLSAMAIGCNMKIDFEDDSEYVEFSTDTGLQFYLLRTEQSPAVTLAIPLNSTSPEQVRLIALGAGILNFSDSLTDCGKISVLPDMSAMIYIAKWREDYAMDRDRVCDWLSSCLSEADKCKRALVDLQQL
jgi:hypothetical protein